MKRQDINTEIDRLESSIRVLVNHNKFETDHPAVLKLEDKIEALCYIENTMLQREQQIKLMDDIMKLQNGRVEKLYRHCFRYTAKKGGSDNLHWVKPWGEQAHDLYRANEQQRLLLQQARQQTNVIAGDLYREANRVAAEYGYELEWPGERLTEDTI